MSKKNNECGNTGFCAGSLMGLFALGAVTGLGVALLYAPKSGKEMRKSISAFSDDTVNKVNEFVHEAQEKIKAGIDEGKTMLARNKEIMVSAFEAGRNAMTKEQVNEEEHSAQQ